MGKSKRRSSQSKRRGNRSARQEEKGGEETDEIQAQLERQRRKRALESADTPNTTKPPVKNQNIVGGYEYDPVKKAYFPKGSSSRLPGTNNASARATPTKPLSHTSSNLAHIRVQEIPTAWIEHASQLCTATRRFHDLRARWAGRIIFSTMQIESSAEREFDPASRQPAGWTSLLPQLRRSQDPNRQTARYKDMPWDLECKNNLHASSRTFDVQLGSDESQLPNFATLVDGGTFFRVAREPHVWNEQQYMGPAWERSTHFEADRGNHMIRFTPRKDSFPNIARLNSGRPRLLDLLHLGPLHSNSMRVDISCCDCNDVAFHPLFGSGSAAEVAVAPRITRNTKSVTLFRDLRSGTSFDMTTEDFSKSDALCVDYLSDNTVLYGHRNGSISLLDTRLKSVQLVSSADEQGGSTTSFLPLANRHMFLAKKSFGSCRLFDIRNMSPKRKESAMVWNMSVPKSAANATLSTCCSGVAVDPTQTIVVAPFADSKRRNHFALWSLTNGHLIGTKVGNATNEKASIGLPHCELRATITPSWKLESDRDGICTVNKKSNAWSLWFKSGQVEPQSPSCVGSIHQLTFRGRPDKFDIGCQIENL